MAAGVAEPGLPALPGEVAVGNVPGGPLCCKSRKVMIKADISG